VRRIVLTIAVLFASACSKSNPAQAVTAAAGQPAAQAQVSTPAAPIQPVPAQLPDVLARVNGETVSKTEFDSAVTNLEARAGGQVPADQRDRVFRGVLNQLVGYKLLSQEVKVRKVVVADAEVEARINEIRKQFPSEDVFMQMLQQRQVTVEKLRADARQDLAVNKLIQDEIGSKIAVTPEQVSDFYAKNPDQFKQGERVRASHILIAFPQNADAAAKAAARTKAEQVLKDVKAGKDFAALAKEHSQDPGSAANGGDLGYFQKGQMVGPFNDTAFSLAPGATSDLVETQFGYHIIRVADKQSARGLPLDEVRPQIQQYLENQNRQQQTEAFVNALKAKGKVEILI
jgi:peptidyl-prolyl cis-trans isomerase C